MYFEHWMTPAKKLREGDLWNLARINVHGSAMFTSTPQDRLWERAEKVFRKTHPKGNSKVHFDNIYRF